MSTETIPLYQLQCISDLDGLKDLEVKEGLIDDVAVPRSYCMNMTCADAQLSLTNRDTHNRAIGAQSIQAQRTFQYSFMNLYSLK